MASFHSILFKRPVHGMKEETVGAPDFFPDLNLDKVVDAITAGKQEYNLKPFFYIPLEDLDAVSYRHEVMRDLENPVLLDSVKAFAERMRVMRDCLKLSADLYYKHQQERWFLDAVDVYCDSAKWLSSKLLTIGLESRGFLGFREYLANYVKSGDFASVAMATKNLQADLSSVKYCMLINHNLIQVRHYNSEVDYSACVEETFEKFSQGAAKDYRAKFYDRDNMNHVEAKVLEMVAQLNPDIFSRLDGYCMENAGYLDERIGLFDREVQFYVAYLEHAALFKRAGLKFCYPVISTENKEVYDYEGFDLALANKLLTDGSPVIRNDFYLEGAERICVVSGPNQGGKTTFARMFGQLHYLACLGFPVPGREARLFLFDRLFTHFGKEEDIKSLRGKLQDDLVRVHHIVSNATSNSIVLINEIFTSTTLNDAIMLGRKIIGILTEMDLLCVFVTFMDELASLNHKTVSMVSTIVPENPASRTFKIVRKPADGLAYAISIAEKYRVTYDCLRERIR